MNGRERISLTKFSEKLLVTQMSKKSLDFPKEHLKDSDLLPTTFRYSEKKYLLLTMYVKNYNTLKKNVMYYVSASICGFTFVNKLVIVHGTLFVFVSTDLIVKLPTVIIQKSKGNYVINNIMQVGNILVSEFCNKAIMDPENEYLLDGSLLIEFQYEIEPPGNYHCSVNYSSLPSFIDSNHYCDNLKVIYPFGKKCDVVLIVRDMQYPCHKEILVAGSKVFANSLQELHTSPNETTKLTINDNPSYFQNVLSYIYCNTLDYLDEKGMVEVYRIANILQIEPLIKKCMDYFKTNLSPFNELTILQKATLYNLPDLKNAVAHYMKKRGSKVLSCPSVLRTLQEIRGI